MKKNYFSLTILFLFFCFHLQAQQLPNSQFEDWSGDTFDGVAQPASWNYSNVTQFGYKFNFAHKESGRSGSCIMIQDQDLEVAGIGETSPGYISLGHPWVYIESLTKVSEATAGTYGGISWSYRPDTMVVWIKRTGSAAMDEDFHLLYYSWSGTSRGDKYKGKNGKCTEVSWNDEESDIRQSTDGNECGTTTAAHQVAEGWIYGRAVYNNWTQIKVPIYYIDNVTPEKMNVIFSASNYPNFRANDGLYTGNSLYVDDVELIYSSKIQKLYLDGSEWKAFNPNTTDLQTYTLADGETTIPTIKAYRGAGQLTNNRGVSTTFLGRQLQGSEITITPGIIDETPTLITVKAEDGSSETTYPILFMHKASNNAYLNGIQANGQDIKGFNPYIKEYEVEVPYGSAKMPVISVSKQEEKQTVQITQPTNINDVTTIVVTAADHQTKQTYTLRYKEALLSDNTLAGILVNGVAIPDFVPTKTNYKVSIPLGTTEMPTIKPISQYPDGMQTITLTAPDHIEGGVYQIAVTTPGNATPKVYKLTFKLELSSYCKLQNLMLDSVAINGFSPDITTYSVELPVGTTKLPTITYVPGDPYQTIDIVEGGLDGTTRITVTAANGDKLVYKLIFSTAKSEVCTLNGILIDGVPLEDFQSDKTSYTIQLPMGTTALPKIEVIKGDEYQKVTIILGSIQGTTRITVSAGNGATTTYQITFSVEQSSNATLKDIAINGVTIPGFDSLTLEYSYTLPKGTSEMPVVSYTPHDAFQTITTRSGGINGDYKITVRPQSGASQTYIIHFNTLKSSDTSLDMIYANGNALAGFDSTIYNYVDTLAANILPTITYQSHEGQKVISYWEENTYTIQVTAESGAKATYTITYIVRKSASALLKMILLDGDSLADFQPNQLSYTNLPIDSGKCPSISVIKDAGQQVSILSPAGAGTANIIVTAENGDQNLYLLYFIDTTTATVKPLDPDPVYTVSGDNTLANILVDGDSLSTYTASTHSYSLQLPAGSSMPIITFVPNTNKQTVITGQTAHGSYSALVIAENGDTASYYVNINIDAYDYALLKDLQVEGQHIDFIPNTLFYQLNLDYEESLPKVTYTTNPGQTVMFYMVDGYHQQLIVTAQSGRQATYNIYYARKASNNALLSDILVDGMSIPGFDSHKYTYIDTIAWRSQVVPSVNPIGAVEGQTITTYFSAVNGVTHIHVVAADGKASADYSIAFPCRLSSNVALNDLRIETAYSVELDFDPGQKDYIITLPYNATISPRIRYEKGEKEQSIDVRLRPIGQPNQIIVRAENGDSCTYSVTFMRESAPQNTLQTIYIGELDGAAIDMTDLSKREFYIDLPYNTKTMSVSYVKQYAEQTVIVQPGGIIQPTVLTVYANNSDVHPTTYTLYPRVNTQNPASLKEIIVDGTAIPDFDSDKYTYIVNRSNATSSPSVDVTPVLDAQVSKTTDSWKSIISVSNGEFENIYSVYFHYPNDTIPNGEFEDWSTTKTSGSNKPTKWNVPGDYLGVYAWTAKASESIKKESNSIVHLSTVYWAALYGALPSVMNLADMNANFAVAGGSTVTPSGTIGFHNTPDQAIINYKYSNKAGNGALFQFHFATMDGNKYIKDYVQSSETQSYQDYSVDLNTNGKGIAGLDIIVDATNLYPKAPIGPTTDCSADLYVDYIRFRYNNQLTSVFVNNVEAERSGNTFSATLKSSEDTKLPQLSFVGEVADQAQTIAWNDPIEVGNYSVRRATITNYGEDGNSSQYALEVKRPLSMLSTLKHILVGGKQINGFTVDQEEYTYTLPYGTQSWPDVTPVLASTLQTCSITLNDSTVFIQVYPEKGDSKTYRIRFAVESVTDASPADIEANGIVYNPNQSIYTITSENMPEISVEKRYDEQEIHIANGVIDVTMAGLANQQYQIKLQPTEVATSGQLAGLELDGITMHGFDPDVYFYQHQLPSIMNFTRRDIQDSVIYIQKPDTLQWRVIGSQEHIYTMVEPSVLSSSTELAGIYVDGVLIDGFTPSTKEYTIYSDNAINITVLGADKNQSVSIYQLNSEYTIHIVAQDGTVGTPYTLKVVPTVSEDASLAHIALNGETLTGFNSNTYQYTIVLPAGAYKDHEPIIPNISYLTSSDKATVEVEAGQLGETTSLFVTAQDGIHKSNYQILFTAEPSHNASLSNIAINNVPLADFDPNRTYYAVQMDTSSILLDWRSNDRYQTISQMNDGNIHIIHVAAQDGVTKRDYVIQVFPITPSNDATLSNILLEGDEMKNYLTNWNTDLFFQSGMNTYNIHLPSSQLVKPEITAIAKLEGQHLQIRQDSTSIYVDVTAPDGLSTNTYTLHFMWNLSNNTSLSAIIVDGESMQAYQANQYVYFIDLPVSTYTLPEIIPIKGDKGQQYATDTTQLSIGQQYTISVVAEDGKTSSQYALIFQTHPSDADTLKMIYANNDSIEGFDPHTFYYYYELAYNESMPEMSYDEANPLQTITLDTLELTEFTFICQYTVQSESGKYNHYTISYRKNPSDLTTLDMVFFNGDSLPTFEPNKFEYIDTIPHGTSIIPTITCIEGDSLQTIHITDSATTLFSNIQYATRIDVIAQNGDSSTYMFYFVVAPSQDATLNMIYCNGIPTTNFDELDTTYTIVLTKEAKTQLPTITFDKKYAEQIVDIQIADSNLIILTVTAEDRNYQMRYYLTFTPYLSDNGLLNAIYADNKLIAGFDPMNDSYVLMVDSLSHVPALSYEKAEEAQQVYIQAQYTYTTDSLVQDVNYTIVVVPENRIDTAYYEVQIQIKSSRPLLPEESDNARLESLNIQGQLISTTLGFDKDFDPNERDYYLIYPIGSDPDLFYTDSDVTYVLQDTLAKISAFDTEQTRMYDHQGRSTTIASSIHITVTAANGENSWTYNIHQKLLLDSLNRTTQILVADYNGDMREIDGFDPDSYYYEYTLSDTRDNAPAFELLYENTESRFAYYSFERDNVSQVVNSDDMTNYAFVNDSTDPTYHLCYHAENGTKFTYKIKFRRSEIKRAQKAMEGDVLIQHIPGSYQIAVASLRANVVFGLYDMNGSMIELVQLGEGNPNSFSTTTDGFGQIYFGHITDYSGCTILTLHPNKVYFWVFTENGKRKIKSGKIVITP